MTAPPTKRSVPRYIFSGQAIGAGAHFRQLDGTTGLNHLVPTQAASVLPPTGGLSEASAPAYRCHVDQPRPRTLFSLQKASSAAAGRCLPDDQYETEVQVDLEAVEVVEKLRIGSVRLHMLSTFTMGAKEPVVTTSGSRIESLWLGKVEARIDLDDELLSACGDQDQLAAAYRGKDADYRQKFAWRFATPAGAAKIEPYGVNHGVHYKCSLVRNIELVGPEEEKQAIGLDGYTITWKGFGRIILGEIHVKGNGRQLTMVRLAMGSDAGGSGSVGSGASNGHTTGN
jgi:hypothetical protein